MLSLKKIKEVLNPEKVSSWEPEEDHWTHAAKVRQDEECRLRDQAYREGNQRRASGVYEKMSDMLGQTTETLDKDRKTGRIY